MSSTSTSGAGDVLGSRRTGTVALTSCRGGSARLLLGKENVLDLGVELDGVHPHLPAHPALLEPPERGFQVDAVARVHRDDARPDSLRHADGPPEVPRPHRPR